MTPDRRPDSWHGWTIAVVGAVAMVFTMGTPYSYGVFLPHLSRFSGVSAVALSVVFSVELLFFYVGAGIVGVFATRVSSRRLLFAAGVVTAVLAPSLFVVRSYLGLLVVFALLGTAIGVVYVVLVSVVPRWFRADRGVATGVLFVGSGVSLLVLPPAWQRAFDVLGVTRGFAVLTGISAISFCLAGLVCRRPPWSRRAPMAVGELGHWLARIAVNRTSQLIFAGLGLAFVWYYLLAAFAVDLFAARGLSDSAAALAFGLIGGVSVLSRITSGAVADRIGYKVTFSASICCSVLGSVLLLIPSVAAVFLAVLVFGIGLGGISTLYVPILLESHDPENDTAIIGVSNVVFGAFAFGVPPAGVALVTVSNSYVAAIVVTVLASLGALWASWRGIDAGM